MYISSERGSALTLTIVVLLVLLVLGGALGMYGMAERVQVEREINDMQAYYLARSGLDSLEFAINTNPALGRHLANMKRVTSEAVELAGGTFTVEVQKTTVDPIYSSYKDPIAIKLISTGMYKGRKRVVEAILTIQGDSDIVLPIIRP